MFPPFVSNTYTYDSENRLISATTPSHTASYAYDAFGRRISKTVDGVTTKYLYDGDEIIAEYDGGGALEAKYVYGAGIDEPILMERGGAVYYYHFDGLGSVVSLTDSQGEAVESYTYDVYGLPNAISSRGNPFLFTGRHYDEETGLYYYRARYYDPRIGRFLQTDIKTWQPNDPRILQKSKDLSEYLNSIFIIYPQLEYNESKVAKLKKAIVQRYNPDIFNGYYSNQLIDEKLVSIFTQSQGTRYPQLLHPYLYCFNNPINYSDPQGDAAIWVSVSAIVLIIVIIIEQITRYAKPDKIPDIPDPPGPPIEPVRPPAPQIYHPPGGR